MYHKKINAREWMLLGFITLCIAAVLFLLCARSVLFEKIIFNQLGMEISDERALVSTQVRNYLWKNRPLSEGFFTQREIAHLSDVKQLFDLQRDLTFMLLAITVLFIVSRPAQNRLWRIIASAGRISFWMVMVLAAIVLFNFDLLFNSFHVISFANDFWLLDPNEHALIRAYPPDYFRLFVVYWLVLLLIVYAALGIFFRPRPRT